MKAALGAVPAICQLVFDGICHLAKSGFVQVILWSLFPMTAALVIAAAIKGLSRLYYKGIVNSRT
jgi:hypothetical protein